MKYPPSDGNSKEFGAFPSEHFALVTAPSPTSSARENYFVKCDVTASKFRGKFFSIFWATSLQQSNMEEEKSNRKWLKVLARSWRNNPLHLLYMSFVGWLAGEAVLEMFLGRLFLTSSWEISLSHGKDRKLKGEAWERLIWVNSCLFIIKMRAWKLIFFSFWSFL